MTNLDAYRLWKVKFDSEQLKKIVCANTNQRVKDVYGNYGRLCGYNPEKGLFILGYVSLGWTAMDKDDIILEDKYNGYRYADAEVFETLYKKGLIKFNQ